MAFNVSFADGKKANGPATPKFPDNRSLVKRWFSDMDKETGVVTDRPIKAVNCTKLTPSEQELDLKGVIALLINYKAGLPEKTGRGKTATGFSGPSKGRDLVVIGKPAYGSGGLLVDTQELRELATYCNALADMADEEVPKIRALLNLPQRTAPVTQAAATTQAAGAAPTRIDLDDEDEPTA